MKQYGFRGRVFEWFSSYLTNRTQRVKVGSNLSDLQETTCGVPQGSVLGPLLFIIFVNDLPNNISAPITQFADDTSIVIAGDDSANIRNRFSEIFQEAETWFHKNSLLLNVSKTKIINFSRNALITDFEVAGRVFEPVEDVKFLGLLLDRRLSWDAHVSQTRKRISRQIYLLRNLSRSVDRQTIMAAYYGLVYSQLKYGIIFWGSSVGFSALFILQKAAVRAIFGLGNRTSCVPYFRQHGILTLPSIYIYETATFVKKNFHLFQRVGSVHSYNTRQVNDLVPSFTDKTYVMKSAYHTTIKIFNSLPEELKLLPLQKFKKELKKILIEKCYYEIRQFYNII